MSAVRWGALAAFAASAWVAGAVAAQEPGGAAASATAAAPAAQATAAAPTPERGRRVYTSYCARCHGLNLNVTSSAYFDLRTFPPDEKGRFLESVTQGKRQMPAWGGIVKPDEMEAIWAYLGQVNGW